LTASVLPVLHVPDEPTARAERWLDAVLDGQDLDVVIGEKEDGIAAWFWSRWRILDAADLHEEELGQIVEGYGREVWLWLAGERTWTQCCSGLIGRINRRLAAGASSAGG
jgi:hypothetical protein